MKSGVQWYEIPVLDMARAKLFYATVLGCEMTDYAMPGREMSMFPWKTGAPFAGGSLVKTDGYIPSKTGTLVYFTCEDISEELARVEKAGGVIAVPKQSIGENGFVAHVDDTEGNRFGLHSMK